MLNKLFYLFVVLGLCLSPTVQAARIIWVMDNATSTQAWINLLTGWGHTVDARAQNWRTLDDGKISELNAADIIIISRDTDSGYYDDGDEPAQWNAITKPIISLTAYVPRSSRWGWINTGSQTTGADPMLEAVLPSHPIFQGVPLGAGNQVDIFSAGADLPDITNPGNGKLLGRRADNQQIWIVEWEPNVEFYSGSGRSAAGKRILFGTNTTLNLTPNGQTLLSNMVKYLVSSFNPGLPTRPGPADRATDVARDVVLGWKPGQYAKIHDVYFGTAFADVNTASRNSQKGVLASQGQDANTYDPTTGLLALGQTYYWRVDEVNAPPDSTIYKGSVWSFTAEPVVFAIRPIAATASSFQSGMDPNKTIDGSGVNANDQHAMTDTTMWLSSMAGPQPTWIQYDFDKVYKLHQMWVWNSNQALEPALGLGAKDVYVEYSTEPNIWTALSGVSQFARATGTANYVHNTTVDFGGVAARYVKITIKNNWGGLLPQYGLSEVRFFQIPVYARQPQPASAATNVALDTTLRWRTGREVARHDIFFGTDPNTVRDATTAVKTMTEASCSLASLAPEYGRTYYWKVNEVNDAATPMSWNGDMWSFSTVAYAVVDDFEAYDDTCNRIFFAWVDGLGHSGSVDCGVAPSGGNGTGSAVGNMQAPFAERTIFQSGVQSMPMTYDNSMGKLYSETQREWTTPQTWTAGAANTLVVYFRGNAPAFLETSPGNIVMNGMGTDIWNLADQGRFTYKQLSGDGSITARIDSLANTNAWAKAGVMIRETLNADSTWAQTLYGGQNGVRFHARLTTGVAAVSDSTVATPDQIAARVPMWVKVERKGNQFNGYYATDAAGTAWTPMVWNPQTITMAADVYIGLAVTSHAAGIVCGARFSSVSTTGKVTGAWQQANLGIEQSTAAGNAPEAFYVAVEDSAKHFKVVSNPDPVLISTGAWEQWQIPLSQFTSTGVNLSAVKKVFIGVGDRNNPKTGGVGKLYIDEIRVTRITTP